MKEEFEPILLLPLGYRTIDCPENPKHYIRKDINDLVIYR